MVSRNVVSTSVPGNKIPVVAPVLDGHFACLRYEPLPKGMKKSKPPSWFYASHNAGSNAFLPDLHHSRLSSQQSDIRTEMERLDRIHDWLRTSTNMPAVSADPYLTKEAHGNQNNSNNVMQSTKNKRSPKVDSPKAISASLPKIETKEKTVLDSLDPNFNSKFPKLGSIMAMSDDPEIIGRRLSVKAKDNDWRKKRSAISLNSGKSLQQSIENNSEMQQAKILPTELSASDYEKMRSKTFYGLNSNFTASSGSHHPLKRNVGPIQRPHSPVVDLFLRQKTRFGDTMMHAKSPSKAVSDQQGRTYMLHAQLKDMLLQR